MIGQLIYFILHIDKSLDTIIHNYGTLVYLFLFVVVFCETGLVVIPFLPGDSLLFAASTFAARGSLNIWLVVAIFAAAAIIGDTVNYEIGRKIGPKVFHKEDSKLFKKEYLDRTRNFYEKHGPITIILARFMPIIRTFAPFVAGVGEMSYIKFLSYNVIGGLMWVSIFSLAGFFFGNIPFVQENFTSVIYVIILISLLPAIVTFIKNKLSKTKPE